MEHVIRLFRAQVKSVSVFCQLKLTSQAADCLAFLLLAHTQAEERLQGEVSSSVLIFHPFYCCCGLCKPSVKQGTQ